MLDALRDVDSAPADDLPRRVGISVRAQPEIVDVSESVGEDLALDPVEHRLIALGVHVLRQAVQPPQLFRVLPGDFPELLLGIPLGDPLPDSVVQAGELLLVVVIKLVAGQLRHAGAVVIAAEIDPVGGDRSPGRAGLSARARPLDAPQGIIDLPPGDALQPPLDGAQLLVLLHHLRRRKGDRLPYRRPVLPPQTETNAAVILLISSPVP
ncbi:MAG: hypothetical protein IKN76_07050 [Oscillospiraceae bacterium]|nr:hypothetical protein [Oscillospiraceae bacterium]